MAARKGVAGAGPRRRSGGQRLQSVDRALTVLEVLAGAGGGGRPLGALARELGLHPSTAHHLLSSLLARGFAEQEPGSGAYRLGPALLTLSRQFLRRSDLAQLAEPYVRALHDELDEWVFLSVLRGGRGYFILELQSAHPFIVNTQSRQSRNLHCTSSNKVLLSGLDPVQARALLEAQGLPGFTPHTLTSVDDVMRDVGRVAEVGHAENREENFEGLRGVSAPIHDATGTLVAALGAAYPVFRADAAREEAIRRAVMRAGAALSARLGHVPTAPAAPASSVVAVAV